MLTAVQSKTTASPTCELRTLAINTDSPAPVAHQIVLRLSKYIDGVLCRFQVTADTNDASLDWQISWRQAWESAGFSFVYGSVYRDVVAADCDLF